MASTNDSQRPRRRRVERGIYLQPNGKYAVCCRHAGRLRFRTVGPSLSEARRHRVALVAAVRDGTEPLSPRLRFDTVVRWWLERFEAKVASGERRPRTLEAHRYYLNQHLLPAFGERRIGSISTDDVAEFLLALRQSGCSPKTTANSLATLRMIVAYARRHDWIAADPIEKLEADERPHALHRQHRVLGRDEIERLLAAAPTAYRPMIATGLYTGLRISEVLGLVWDDVDLTAGVIHVRAQLSRAHRGEPARRVAPKTVASLRDVPLVPQLAELLVSQRARARTRSSDDWVFPTSNGTPHGQRNLCRRGLQRAADKAGLNSSDTPRLRFHDLRHTFASHLIIDLQLDVAQVSRILGHASTTITLDVYTHLFDDARHARELRERMATSAFVQLLQGAT